MSEETPAISNVIRPTFESRPRQTDEAATVVRPGADEYRQLHVYGHAAGYFVALMEDAGGPEGDVLKFVIAIAILRTLEIIDKPTIAD